MPSRGFVKPDTPELEAHGSVKGGKRQARARALKSKYYIEEAIDGGAFADIALISKGPLFISACDRCIRECELRMERALHRNVEMLDLKVTEEDFENESGANYYRACGCNKRVLWVCFVDRE